MTHLRISTEGIGRLGEDLGLIADYLEVRAHYTRDGSVERYGFPSPTGWQALDRVLGDYERARVAMCAELRTLRDLAKAAGPCFLQAEEISDPRIRRLR